MPSYGSYNFNLSVLKSLGLAQNVVMVKYMFMYTVHRFEIQLACYRLVQFITYGQNKRFML